MNRIIVIFTLALGLSACGGDSDSGKCSDSMIESIGLTIESACSDLAYAGYTEDDFKLNDNGEIDMNSIASMEAPVRKCRNGFQSVVNQYPSLNCSATDAYGNTEKLTAEMFREAIDGFDKFLDLF